MLHYTPQNKIVGWRKNFAKYISTCNGAKTLNIGPREAPEDEKKGLFSILGHL